MNMVADGLAEFRVIVIYFLPIAFKYYTLNLLSKLQTASTENDTEHRQRSKLLTAEMPEGNLKELDSRPGGTFSNLRWSIPSW